VEFQARRDGGCEWIKAKVNKVRVFTVSCDRNSANSNHAGRTTLTD